MVPDRARVVVRVLATLCGVVAISACDRKFFEPPMRAMATVSLTGSAVVAPVTTGSSGTATFERSLGDFNFVDYIIDLKSMQGIRAVHLHLGAAGSNQASTDPPLVSLFDSIPGIPLPDINGRFMENNFTVTELRPKGISLDSLEALVAKGMVYMDIHTRAFPNGEIRGQLAK